LPVCSPATFVNLMASRQFTPALKQVENNFRALQWCNTIYITTNGLTPGGSSTVHIYTQTKHRTTQ